MIDHQTLLRPRTRMRPLGYMAALLLALVASTIGYEGYVANREAAAVTRNNEQLRSRLFASRQEPSPQDQELRKQWAALQQERAYPWAKVFRAVEHVSDPDIELLEFRPDRRAGSLILKGEGRTSDSVMRFLERLQDDPTFSRVYLAHTASMERGRLLTREFELHLNLYEMRH